MGGVICVSHNLIEFYLDKLWKILKEMGVPEHLTSWEICMQVKKQQLEPAMEQWTGSKLGKEYVKAVYYHPAYLTYMQSISWETLGWKKHKLESRLLGEISITSDMQMIPPLWQKAITSWQVDGETVETMTAFIFLGSKISADGDCSHELKRRLLLGRKALTNLASIL